MKKWTVLLLTIAFAGIIFWSCSDDGGGTNEPINKIPTLTVTNPIPYTGYDIGQVIQVKTTADDEDGTIQEVRFYIDYVGIDAASVFPYNADLNTDTLSYGPHILKVEAIDNDGAKAEKEIPFGINPSKPSSLQIQQNNVYTFTISWIPGSGSEGCKIQRKIDDGVFIDLGSTTNTTYIDSTVSKNSFSMVYYQIASYNDIYESPYEQQSYTIDFPNPYNLSYTKIDLSTIKLDWNQNSDGEEGFKIDKKVGDGEYIIGYAGVGPNAETWTDSNAEINEILRYRIYGFKGDNTSSSVETALINNTFPAPSNFNVIHTSVTTATLSWNDNSVGEEAFEIERKLDTESNYTKIAEITGSSATIKNYEDSSIDPGHIYDYRVRAVKGDSSSVYAAVAGYNSFPAPSNLTLQQNNIFDITLNWTDNSLGEDGFKIDRKYEDNPWLENYASVSGNIVTWNETLGDTGKYYYRVKGFYNTSESSASSTVDVHASFLDNPMLLVPAGTFQMGQVGVAEPVHEVTISHSYYLAKYETTQKQWTDIMGSNPATSYGVGYDFPVYNLSWYSIIVYCNKRSIAEGLNPCYVINGSSNPSDWGSVPTISNSAWDSAVCKWENNGYRLPTEAEWEYAAQYNDDRVYPWGSANPSNLLCNNNETVGLATQVGSYLNGNNLLGFCDIAGNVYEWVWDWSANYTSTILTDPTGPTSIQQYRILRGGSWYTDNSSVRCAWRSIGYPYNSNWHSGFRVARNNPDDPRPPGNMIEVPTGSFEMGQIIETDTIAAPLHTVNITRPYYLGRYEVTQAEWQNIMGSNPAYFSSDLNRPIETISWYDLLVFCNKKSINENLSPCYTISGSTDPADWGAVPTASNTAWDAVICNWSAKGYRMPTEAEWEYAAQYNDERTYPWGNTEASSLLCNYNRNVGTTTAVGSYSLGNSLVGLCDMSGNVWEYLWDWYSVYTSSTQTDPSGPSSTQTFRVLRGGAWQSTSTNVLKSAYRGFDEPYTKSANYGFRLARTK